MNISKERVVTVMGTEKGDTPQPGSGSRLPSVEAGCHSH